MQNTAIYINVLYNKITGSLNSNDIKNVKSVKPFSHHVFTAVTYVYIKK